MGNNLGIELKGKHIVLSKKDYIGSDVERVFKCEGGFGCSPVTLGRAIFGYFIFDREQCRVEGYEVDRLATKKEIQLAETKYQMSQKQQEMST